MSSVEFNRFKKLLKDKGYFVTRPRVILFRLLQRNSALTLKELINHTLCHDQVTVYRNVDLFYKLRIVDRIQLGWKTRIELSNVLQRHHHITYAGCGKVSVLEECPIIEKEITKLIKTKRFRPIDHQLEIRGECLACQNIST